MTFRLPDDLAAELRDLPNQTHFVEAALRDALGVTCPACAGSGRVPGSAVAIPDFREGRLPRLSREKALRLKELVRLGREIGATEVELSATDTPSRLEFRLKRRSDQLLRGYLDDAASRSLPN